MKLHKNRRLMPTEAGEMTSDRAVYSQERRDVSEMNATITALRSRLSLVLSALEEMRKAHKCGCAACVLAGRAMAYDGEMME